MSLTSVQIRPVTGSNVDINTVDGSGNHLYPLSSFEPEVDLPEVVYKKMQQTGVWPTFSYPGAATIIAIGHVLGLGASDSARSIDAMTKRAALTDACLPPLDPATTYTSRKHGTLRVQYDHWTETADVEFHCVLVKIPLAALNPANMEFTINFKCFTPYFVGTGTQTIYPM